MSVALSFMVMGSMSARTAKQSEEQKNYKESSKKYRMFVEDNATDNLKQAKAARAAAVKEYNMAKIEIMKSDSKNAAVAEAYLKSFQDTQSGKKDKAKYEEAKKARREFNAAWKNNYKQYSRDSRLKTARAKKAAAQKAIESAEAEIRKNNPDAEKLWKSKNEAKKELKDSRKKSNKQKEKKEKKSKSSKKSENK